jgi:hypothetical protein
VFRNNRNKQKTNRNSRKFGKISTFLIPHTISSVCFGCFDTGPKHRNKPKKKILVSRKSKPKNNRNRLSFGLFLFESRKKDNGFEDPLIENVFWRFFRFVSVCYENILFVSVVSILVRNTETNRKNCFLVSQNKPKNNRNRLSFGLFRLEPKKKFDCFEDTLMADPPSHIPGTIHMMKVPGWSPMRVHDVVGDLPSIIHIMKAAS